MKEMIGLKKERNRWFVAAMHRAQLLSEAKELLKKAVPEIYLESHGNTELVEDIQRFIGKI